MALLFILAEEMTVLAEIRSYVRQIDLRRFRLLLHIQFPILVFLCSFRRPGPLLGFQRRPGLWGRGSGDLLPCECKHP